MGRLTLITLWLTLSGWTAVCRPNEVADSIRSIADAIDGTDEVACREAEAACRTLPDGPAKRLATYGVSVMRVFQGRYDDAETALDGLPAATLNAPTFVRLRLWLTLQRRDADEATTLIQRAITIVESDPSEAEQKETAAFLAKVAAMIDGAPNASVVSREAKIAFKQRLAKLESQTLRATVKASYNEAKARAASLTTLRDEFGNLTPEVIARKHDEAKAKLAEVEKARVDATENRRLLLIEQSQQIAAVQSEKRECLSRKSAIKKELKTPTAGHPGPPPVPPVSPGRPPRAPRPIDGQPPDALVVAAYQIELTAWELANAKFAEDQRVFEERREIYGNLMKEYLTKHQERVTRLQAEMTTLAERLKEIAAELKKFENQRSESRRSLTAVQSECRECRQRAAVMQAAASSTNFDRVEESLFSPANFDLLVIADEERRLTAAAAKLPSSRSPVAKAAKKGKDSE